MATDKTNNLTYFIQDLVNTIHANNSNFTTINAQDISSSITLQSKSVTPSGSAQTITPDSGTYGLSSVTVTKIPYTYYTNTKATVTNNTSGGTSSGTITAGKQIKFSAGYNPSDVYYTAESYTYMTNTAGSVTNNTTLPSGSSSSGTLNCGSYIKIAAGYYASDLYYYGQNYTYKTNTKAAYSSATSNPNYTNQVTITPSGNSQYVKITAGYTDNAEITIKDIPYNYYTNTLGTSGTANPTFSGATASYSYTIPAGYYAGDTTVSGSASMTDNGAVSKSIGYGEAYTVPAGYHNGSGKVSCSVSAGSITNNTSGGTSTATITAGKQIKIGKGYYASDVYYTAQSKTYMTDTAAAYTNNGTTNPSYTNKVTVTPSGSAQYVKITAGYTDNAEITVAKIPYTYYTNDAVSLSTTSITPSGSSQTVTIGKGYTTGGTCTVAAIPSNYVNINNYSTISDGDSLTARGVSFSSGTLTFTVDMDSEVGTDFIGTGVESIDVKYDVGTVTTGTSASGTSVSTITPGTSNKYVNFTSGYASSGKYWTISGSSNLTASNIKSGVSIFGVTGTAQTVSSGKCIFGLNTSTWYNPRQYYCYTAVTRMTYTLSKSFTINGTTYYGLAMLSTYVERAWVNGKEITVGSVCRIGRIYCYGSSGWDGFLYAFLYRYSSTVYYIVTTTSTFYTCTANTSYLNSTYNYTSIQMIADVIFSSGSWDDDDNWCGDMPLCSALPSTKSSSTYSTYRYYYISPFADTSTSNVGMCPTSYIYSTSWTNGLSEEDGLYRLSAVKIYGTSSAIGVLAYFDILSGYTQVAYTA